MTTTNMLILAVLINVFIGNMAQRERQKTIIEIVERVELQGEINE